MQFARCSTRLFVGPKLVLPCLLQGARWPPFLVCNRRSSETRCRDWQWCPGVDEPRLVEINIAEGPLQARAPMFFRGGITMLYTTNLSMGAMCRYPDAEKDNGDHAKAALF